MEGVSYYGFEHVDILLGAGSDIVSVQGVSQGSYRLDLSTHTVTNIYTADNGVDNARLIEVNEAIRSHPVEAIGSVLRGHMADMKRIV